MKDLLSIVVLILYFVAVGAAGKNKKKKKAKQRASGKREVQFEQAFERIMESARSMEKTASAGKTASKDRKKPAITDAEEGEDPCHEAMLSPQHEGMKSRIVSQTQMNEAGEGEDPCHTVDEPQDAGEHEESPVLCSPIFNTEDKDAFAQDILRGVIMSEVLKRPERRTFGRSVKRGA